MRYYNDKNWKDDGEMWSNHNSHALLMGMEKATTIFFPNIWQFLIKWNINTLWLPVLLCSIYSRERKTYPHRDLHMNIHSDFVYNSLKLETTQTSINRKRGKQIVIYSCDRIDSTIQKWTTAATCDHIN